MYEELVDVSNNLLLYYDIDKIKPYSVYVWSKEKSDDIGENLFDIISDRVIFYNDRHIIIKDAIPIIEKIQYKLKEIENLCNK
ncbi:hypothetical protein [Romboutsia ilealis]|uniref:hypothetical protein n=1 Tax=Romboutsia ilealis TaxID=1115758 RepID=UPI002729926D|nr:hypothetical protein [Romboutsia ilealis]